MDRNHIQLDPKKILLIGLRGCGKSTLAPLLADSMGIASLDLDRMTLGRLVSPTVADAWSRLGEPAFRAAEVEALTDALSGQSAVIAAGGGAPTAPGAADLIRSHCNRHNLLVIYLQCSPDVLRQRLTTSAHNDPDRPSLTGADPLDEIEKVFAARDTLYQSLAQQTLDADQSMDRVITAAQQAVTHFFA
jgi:shikimate kinase